MLVQVGVAVAVVVLRPPDLVVVGKHRPEPLHRPLLPLHLHGVQLLKRGLLLREQLRLHGIPVPVGWVVFDYPQISFCLLSTFYRYRVLLPLLQQLPQESPLMLLLLQVVVKRQHTIQLLVVAVLLLPAVQCYTVMTRLLPKMRLVSDILFSGIILNANVDF